MLRQLGPERVIPWFGALEVPMLGQLGSERVLPWLLALLTNSLTDIS